eukprot:2661683-Pleurochrysis_carterae.AAC.2
MGSERDCRAAPPRSWRSWYAPAGAAIGNAARIGPDTISWRDILSNVDAMASDDVASNPSGVEGSEAIGGGVVLALKWRGAQVGAMRVQEQEGGQRKHT